jgi:hypothetical protein
MCKPTIIKLTQTYFAHELEDINSDGRCAVLLHVLMC